MKQFYVYIMANWPRGRLYVGMTNAIQRRVYEHKGKLRPGFTANYNLTKLVFVETVDDPMAAIEREKEIKGWLRRRKIALIESVNPNWRDLSDDW
jgi:putative endonuclease